MAWPSPLSHLGCHGFLIWMKRRAGQQVVFNLVER